ncbi:hypothetical protein [Microbacterium terregens]|uniref:Uncharacterized protein n=1 Tax=Microbacterium terregens TaxID=69363 RepID=A0ABV5SZ56_9MICO
MTVDLSWQVRSLNDADIRMVSASVLSVAVALEELTSSVATVGLRNDSRAAIDIAWTGNPENAEGSTHLESAHKSIRTMCLAATDHMRAFVQGIRSRRTTVANWTLTRGALESLGGAHYLVGTRDAAQLLSRYVATILEETKFNKGQTFAYRYGDTVNVDEYRLGARSILEERGITLESGASPTSLARAVIEDAAPGSDAKARYSQLSAVAHGQAPGVHMFMPEETGMIALPRALAIDAAHMQIACAQLVGTELVNYFGPSRLATERWNEQRKRATATVLLHAREAGDQLPS